MNNLLKMLFETKEAIYTYFGLELDYWNVHDYTDAYWKTIDDESIQWGYCENINDEYDEPIYKKGVHTTKDFTMVLVRHFSNPEYFILDNLKKVK